MSLPPHSSSAAAVAAVTGPATAVAGAGAGPAPGCRYAGDLPRLKAAPEVQQVYNVTGEVDLLLVVLARNVEDFERISRRLFSADPKIRRYTTSVVMDHIASALPARSLG